VGEKLDWLKKKLSNTTIKKIRAKFHSLCGEMFNRRPIVTSVLMAVVVFVLMKGVHSFFDFVASKDFEYIKDIISLVRSSSFVSFAVSILVPAFIYRTHIKQDLLIKGRNAEEMGLFYSSMNADDESRQLSLDMMKKSGIRSQNVRIAGATGWNTFGHAESPLHEAVKNCENRLEIILAYPWSNGVKERVLELCQHPSKYRKELKRYRKEILDTLVMLQTSNLKAADVKVLLYSYAPFWKANIFDKHAWVQSYPAKKHVDEAACFAYEKVQTGIFEEHSKRFTLLTKSPMMYPVDLEKGTVALRAEGKAEEVDVFERPEDYTHKL